VLVVEVTTPDSLQMKPSVLIAFVVATFLCSSASGQSKVKGWEDQEPKYPVPDDGTKFEWLREYLLLIEKLPVADFARGYPALLEKLKGADPEARCAALRAMGELEDPSAIPFLVPILRNSDRNSQVYAGWAIEKIVSSRELKRQGSSNQGQRYIEPPTAGELDLKPMRWIVFEMLTCGEPSIQGYAVTMTGYLDLEELRPIVEALRASRHPSVTGQIDYFLGIMDRSKR
jgi:hypothetical protein